MRSVLVLFAAAGLAACAPSPVVQESAYDTRFDPVRADTMVAVNFAPGASACSIMARRSARQITLTLSDVTADLLAERGAIGESQGKCFGWCLLSQLATD